MFKKLHLQLTFLGASISSFILVAMSFFCLSFSEAETREAYFSDFQKNISVLIGYLEGQSTLSHSWLSQICTETHFKIDIRDNGHALIFDSLNPRPSDDALFAQARQIARDRYMMLEEAFSGQSVFSSHKEFSFGEKAGGAGSGSSQYYASVAFLAKNGGVLNIAVLCPLDRLQGKLRQRRLFFLLADCAGILLLGVFFWIFSWRMIRPLSISRKRQTEFIAAASHELRSPLAVMLSCLSAMEHASPAQATAFSQAIRQEGKRMGRLINDMLALSNMDSPRFSIQKSPVELDTLLLSVYEKFESLAREKEIAFSIALPDALLPACSCDKGRVLQVLSILLDNALSYTPNGGKIRLLLQRADRAGFLIRVDDSGPGIPDHEKKAVFGRFYRCDSSHEDKEHFGLGLCIAQEIVRMHKGKLWVEDSALGGASFVMSLP